MPLTIDAAATEWISVDEVKRHANIPSSTSSDEEIEMMRDAAQDVVQGLIGPILWRVVTEVVAAGVGGMAVLRYAPVVSVESVTSSTVDQVYALNSQAGLLSGLTPGTFTVSYTAGRSTVPAAIRMATLIIAAHLWETQLGSAPTQLQDDFSNTPTAGVGYAIPNRAADLLAPYLLLPGVA